MYTYVFVDVMRKRSCVNRDHTRCAEGAGRRGAGAGEARTPLVIPTCFILLNLNQPWKIICGKLKTCERVNYVWRKIHRWYLRLMKVYIFHLSSL